MMMMMMMMMLIFDMLMSIEVALMLVSGQSAKQIVSHEPGDRLPLLNSRPTLTFTATDGVECHRPLASASHTAVHSHSLNRSVRSPAP